MPDVLSGSKIQLSSSSEATFFRNAAWSVARSSVSRLTFSVFEKTSSLAYLLIL